MPLLQLVEVVSQHPGRCGRPQSPMAASRVLRGISRFRCELAPCPRPSWLSLASRLVVKPLLGGACIIEEGESLLDDWQVRGVAAHSTEVLAASALQRCRIAWGMS
jgi:hypothetical protein